MFSLGPKGGTSSDDTEKPSDGRRGWSVGRGRGSAGRRFSARGFKPVSKQRPSHQRGFDGDRWLCSHWGPRAAPAARTRGSLAMIAGLGCKTGPRVGASRRKGLNQFSKQTHLPMHAHLATGIRAPRSLSFGIQVSADVASGGVLGGAMPSSSCMGRAQNPATHDGTQHRD